VQEKGGCDSKNKSRYLHGTLGSRVGSIPKTNLECLKIVRSLIQYTCICIFENVENQMDIRLGESPCIHYFKQYLRVEVETITKNRLHNKVCPGGCTVVNINSAFSHIYIHVYYTSTYIPTRIICIICFVGPLVHKKKYIYIVCIPRVIIIYISYYISLLSIFSESRDGCAVWS